MAIPSQLNIGRLIGAAGSSVPVIGDVGTMAFIKKKAGTQIGIGASQGLKWLGGPIAVASWSYLAYQNRHLPGHIYGNMQIGYGQMMQHEGFQEVDRTTRSRKSTGGRSRTRNRTTSYKRGKFRKGDGPYILVNKSRKGDGPSTLSQRTRKSPSYGKRRRRCSSRSKSGKPCLRPRGHSGRHRYL